MLYWKSYTRASDLYQIWPKIQKQHTHYKIVMTFYRSRPATWVRVAGHMHHSSAPIPAEQQLRPDLSVFNHDQLSRDWTATIPVPMRLSHVLKQLVTPWKPILANTMTSWDFTGIQLTVRQMSLYVTVEIVLTGKRHELPVFSKAARVHTDPSPSTNPVSTSPFSFI
jgi:hypothetical protein